MRKPVSKMTALIAVSLVATPAAASGRTPERSRWLFREVRYWCCGPQVFHVTVTRSGRILFGREAVALNVLRRRLIEVGELTPPFYVVLEHGRDASPAALRNTRLVFDRSPLCAQGLCVERRRWNAFWRKRGLSKGP